MRLIDVAIPKFGDNTSGALPPSKVLSTDFQLPTLFGRGDEEYHVDYEDDDPPKGESKVQDGSLQVKCTGVDITPSYQSFVFAAAHL